MHRRIQTAIRLSALIVIVTLLFACHGMPINIPADPGERVANGDRVQVDRELTVPADLLVVLLSIVLMPAAVSS